MAWKWIEKLRGERCPKCGRGRMSFGLYCRGDYACDTTKHRDRNGTSLIGVEHLWRQCGKCRWIVAERTRVSRRSSSELRMVKN